MLMLWGETPNSIAPVEHQLRTDITSFRGIDAPEAPRSFAMLRVFPHRLNARAAQAVRQRLMYPRSGRRLSPPQPDQRPQPLRTFPEGYELVPKAYIFGSLSYKD